jgi:hypothetical protein
MECLLSLVWWARLGLLMDLIGAGFLWQGGTPLVWRPRYAAWSPAGYDPEKEQKEWQAWDAKLQRRNRIGVVLLVLGFALQLISTWAGR